MSRLFLNSFFHPLHHPFKALLAGDQDQKQNNSWNYAASVSEGLASI